MLAGACFVLAALVGLAGASALAAPILLAPLFAHFAALRALHELFALGGALAGGAGGVLGVIAMLGGAPRGPWIGWAMLAFALSSAAAIALGAGSGREYFSWPLALNLVLLAGLGGLLVEVFRAREILARRTPEGLWLVGFGALFVVASVAESSAYVLPALARDFVRDLSLQWHAIDTLFAGLNALLYGCGVLVLADKPKQLRGRMLFAIACFGVLFTFAHHHYASPQPAVFKSLAVAASMLALISFFRHLSAYRAQQEVEKAADHGLWRTIEFWTLVSILSGVLYAVPQINLIVHGTNLVVIHAMGSMIGVSFMLVMACGLRLAARPHMISWRRVDQATRLVNAALAGLWLSLGADGLIEGVGRIHGDYQTYQPWRDAAMAAFPALGLILSVGLSLLCVELIRVNAGRRPAASDELAKSIARPPL